MKLALLLVLVPCLAAAAPVRYTLDPAQTEIVALTHPAGLFGGAAHSHVIAARNPTGTIVYDPEAPERSRVEIRLAAASLDNDDPALRKKHGQEKAMSDKDRRQIGETMRSPSQLDVGRFPEISFASTSVKRLEDGRLELSGKLSLHGVEAPLTLPVTVHVEGGELRGQGTAHLGQRAFGIQPYSAGMGTIRNADGVELRISLVGRAETAAGVGSGAPSTP